jgi:hypothetical protein
MIRRHSLLGVCLAGWAALQGFPSVGAAQRKIEVVPFVGLYIPTANVVDQFDSACSCQVSTKQRTALDVGARVVVWATDRLALEGAFGYSPSGATTTAPGYATIDRSGTVITTTARVLAALGSRTRNRYVYLSGGIGLVVRGGDAWNGTMGRTRLAGVVGAGVRFAVAPPLALRAELDDLLYSAQFSTAQTRPTQSQFQHDLALSLGLAVPIGGR